MNDDSSRNIELISDLYRQAPPLEPPRRLDDAILRAARQSVATRRRPRRWAVPASMAALLVLGVGLVRLTLQEIPQALHSSERELPQALHPADSPTPASIAPERSVGGIRGEAKERAAKTDADVGLSAPAAPLHDAVAPPTTRPAREAPAQASEPLPHSLQRQLSETPEEEARRPYNEVRAADQWLETIAALRKQGRVEEAQASWAAFRRQYPHYPVKDMPGDDPRP